jgi:hypothetical protein
MSSMTMLVQQVRYDDYGSRMVEARAILDTKMKTWLANS